MAYAPVVEPLRRVGITDGSHRLPIAPNVIERNFFSRGEPDLLAVPATFLLLGRLHLPAIMDLFSRKIVDWAMRDHTQVEVPPLRWPSSSRTRGRA
ncbi:hypothetical protein [Bradyrhizobium sp. STM 3562]|uniref:hypothetical protein n=1 Tax=Bradyrhizobium sp. STM 3562 TaxID=578924 RepID=UPI0038904A0D